MASTSQTEGSPLLGKQASTARPQDSQSYINTNQKLKHRRYDSSASSRMEEQDDGQSLFSHVSLDVTPTYYRLLGSHVLSLLPGLAFQLATIMLAFHAPCHIHYESDDRRICRHLLGDWMSITAFVLGMLSWIAAYSIRPALSKIVEWSSLLFQSQQVNSTPGRPSSAIISSLAFVLLRTTVLECIRMFNIIVINAVLFAGLAHLQGQGKAQDDSQVQIQLHWLLHWYDPRFTVGLWVAIGWCLTEFVVSSFQIFDRLSLYRCLFEEGLIEEEGNSSMPAATAYTPATSFFVNGSHSPSGDYTSDSAATVRAFSKSTTAPAAQNDQHSSVSRLKSNVYQGEESAFSLGNEVDEQEMYRLKDRLDEEVDTLLQARMRDELQQTLGQPLTEVPIVLCALWRIDGWLWNLGSTLLMSASVALAQGALTDSIPTLFPPFRLIKTTLFILIGLHSFFTAMWTISVGYLSFAFVTYTSMLAGLGLCISALGRWGLLV